ncbi:MAG: N-acetylglucosamine-6-phosphate deacetylase [Cyanobacteria bacterium P01_F01_bin.42]
MWITNARLVGHPETAPHERAHLEFDAAHRLRQVQTKLPEPLPVETLDLADDFLSLGGVDLQINGALGFPFPDLQPGEAGSQQLTKIGEFLWAQGVDAYTPTVVTTSVQKFQNALRCLHQFRPSPTVPTAKILGAHLEGPCLNPSKRGAHPEQHLQPLTAASMEAVIGEYGKQVSIITLAPELDTSGRTLKALRTQLPDSAVISLGHSLASDEEAAQAFTAGATMVTHAFNAMPALHHRNPGLLAAALTTERVWCGFIADGQHVSPRMLKLLLQCRPEDGLFLVSDALSPLGLPDGDYPWDERTITVTEGTARLPNGTLSGTTRPLLHAVINLVRWRCCSPERAIALATDAPRRAMGLPGIREGLAMHQFLRWTYRPESREISWERLK